MMRKLKASNQMDHVQDLVAGADPPCVHENIVQFFLMSMCVFIIRSLHLLIFSA